jgi:hypothetical protein
MYHTTSLGSWDVSKIFGRNCPGDASLIQQGIAFVTSNRVEGVFRKWLEADGSVPVADRYLGAASELESEDPHGPGPLNPFDDGEEEEDVHVG